jgi:SAM-dependent methyltransferase
MKGQSARSDSWASGESYQRYVGRWSKLVASEFIGWLDAPPQKHWLDIGCGTGSLSRAILELTSPATVKGIDPSQSHVSFAHDTIHDERAGFFVGTAESVQLPSDSFDFVVSGLVLNFVPDPERGVSEMKRLTHKGGIIGAYVWDYADKMELMRYFWNAAVAFDKTAVALDEGNRFPLCRPEALEALFTAVGLQNVDVRSIDIPTRFENFKDLWLPFLGGQGPAPGYAMSLDEERRSLLRDRLRSALPVTDDGSINLIARAWAVKGIRP